MPSGADPDGRIRQPLWSRRRLTSSIVTDVRSLCHPLLVGSRINTLIYRAASRGGIGHDHLMIKTEHGIISGQTPSIELSLAPSVVSAGLIQRKRKTRHLRRTFFASDFCSFPIYNPCFPLVYKRKAGHPAKRGSIQHITHHITHS